MKVLKDLAKRTHATFDCFVMALLSHGTEGGIYTTDEEVIMIDTIVTMFGAQKCKSLAGKPKALLHPSL